MRGKWAIFIPVCLSLAVGIIGLHFVEFTQTGDNQAHGTSAVETFVAAFVTLYGILCFLLAFKTSTPLAV